MTLTDAQRLKFRVLASGLSLSSSARDRLRDISGDQPLSSDDFASTSGLILRLEDNVWVNAPIALYNPNFVGRSPYLLDCSSDAFVVRGGGLESEAWYWLQPAFHGATGGDGRPYNDFVVTHGDRVRLSPLHGCGMVCTFCDVPYGVRYALKSIDSMLAALTTALADPRQPARHMLISGGTPRPRDIEWLKSVYRAVLTRFPAVDIDIMMVPTGELLDVDELARLGVSELSINLELFSDEAARRLMPQKHRQGQSHYLRFIERAASILGQGRVRSMLMVGLEPIEQTLLGVQAIVDHGGVPVLSPFRPDPSTPLRESLPPAADDLEAAFLAATEIVSRSSAVLGPRCIPCSHNTLTLADHTDRAEYRYGVPVLA